MYWNKISQNAIILSLKGSSYRIDIIKDMFRQHLSLQGDIKLLGSRWKICAVNPSGVKPSPIGFAKEGVDLEKSSHEIETTRYDNLPNICLFRIAFGRGQKIGRPIIHRLVCFFGSLSYFFRIHTRIFLWDQCHCFQYPRKPHLRR